VFATCFGVVLRQNVSFWTLATSQAGVHENAWSSAYTRFYELMTRNNEHKTLLFTHWNFVRCFRLCGAARTKGVILTRYCLHRASPTLIHLTPDLVSGDRFLGKTRPSTVDGLHHNYIYQSVTFVLFWFRYTIAQKSWFHTNTHSPLVQTFVLRIQDSFL
jgi:hypothetical protein